MPRFIERHKTQAGLTIDGDREYALTSWIEQEIEDSLSARKQLDSLWRECLQMYNGVPRLDTRDVPIPNAPNIEITIGAIASDTIYAQAVDLIFNTSPLVTCRPKPKFKEDRDTVYDAKAMQRFVNHIAQDEEAGLRAAVDNAVLDDIQLGTGILYIPWVEKLKKTKTAKVLSAGARFYAMPPEDVIVAGGSNADIQNLPLIGLRFYYTMQQLADAASRNKWNLDGVQPLHAKGWVRSTREMLGRQQDSLNHRGTMTDVIKIWCCFDIDGDGIDEDLYVVWNHSGRKIMYVNYAPEDKRGIEAMVYQRIAHLFYGMGVLQMLKPYEEKLTDVHNYATLNILLANSRVWVGDETLPETLKIWPSKVITGQSADSLKSLQMADVYPSIWQDQMITMQLANQRVGISETGKGTNIPSRTPGITMMTAMQQVNKRFTPAFDGMKICIAGALRQACYRFSERIKAGDQRAMLHIYNVLGPDDGNRVINILRRDTFDEHVDIELTASSASTNREADRQNAIMLTNILAQYYQRTIELIMLSANPQTPPEVATIARKIADAAGEIIDRTIRTFDQVRDPATFVIQVEEELNSIEQTSEQQQGLMQLMQMLGASGQGSQPGQQQLPAPGGGEQAQGGQE